VARSLPHSENECEESINNVWSCESGDLKAIWSWIYIIKVLAIIVYIWSFDGFYRLKSLWTVGHSNVNVISWCCQGGCCRNDYCLSMWKGFELLIYKGLWSSATPITKDGRPKIVDAQLTLVSDMAHRVSRFLFRLKRQPMPHLKMSATNCHSDYPRFKSKNCWRAIDAHFQQAAGSVFLPFVDFQGGQYIQRRQWRTTVNILQLTVGYLNTPEIDPPKMQNSRLEPTALGTPSKTHMLTSTGTVWHITRRQVGLLDRFGTKLNCCCGPNPDQWHVTQTHCSH